MYQGRLEYAKQCLATYCASTLDALTIRLQVALQDELTGTHAVIVDETHQEIMRYRKACVVE